MPRAALATGYDGATARDGRVNKGRTRGSASRGPGARNPSVAWIDPLPTALSSRPGRIGHEPVVGPHGNSR